MTTAHGVFETMGAVGGALPLWERHLARLAGVARRLGITCEVPSDLRHRACELLLETGQENGILRIVLTARGWDMTTRPRRPAPEPLRLHRVVDARRTGDPSAGIKSTVRVCIDAAAAAARDAGADDALLVDRDGAVRETTTGNVFVVLRGRWCTPRLDGWVLPGVARALLLEGMARRGVRVAERRLTVADLEASEGLWVTNAVYGPRRAALSEGTASRDRRLLEVWAESLLAAGV